MKLQLKTLAKARDALNKLANTEGLKGIIAYKIKRNISSINDVLNPYNETEKEIIRKYALKDDEGNIIQNDNDQLTITDIVAFSNEIEECQNEVFDIDINVIKFNELNDVGLSANQIEALEFMLNFDE